MEYREYGKTGIKISAIGAGGMRYSDPEKIDEMGQIPYEAAKLGINYFDTAAGYCNDYSQRILGAGLKLIKKDGLEYYISTKSASSDESNMRKDLEKSLKEIGVDHIDFYHTWAVNTVEKFNDRKAKGAFKALAKLKEEGLIKHIVASSHMSGNEIAEYLVKERIFEGLTIGFCAINSPFRMEGLQAAHKAGMGVVTMNPLGGGMITDNPDRFNFIKTFPEQSILEAAIHFNLAYKEITSVLVGFRSIEDVRSAVKTIDTYKPISDEEITRIRNNIDKEFDQLCTTCNYCKDCHQGIPVVKFMETHSYYLLYKNVNAVNGRLKWTWDIFDGVDKLNDCTECRKCEEACTQKLPILERFEELKKILK